MNASPDQLDMRVLVLAPTARDAGVTQSLLTKAGLHCEVCQSVLSLAERVGEGAGAAVTTEDAIAAEGIDELLDLLKKQPAWSKLPLVVLMQGAGHSPATARVLEALDNVMLLERPAPMRTVISAVQAALRERRRQYQIRDQMEEIQQLLAAAQAARAEAEHASRLKDEFLATVSHELRTPLSAILLWSRMLASNKVTERDRTEAIGAIVRSAEAQRQLIEDLLDMARIMSGKLRLNLREMDLAQAVRAAVDAVRPMATVKRITLDVKLDDRHAPVLGDPDRLQQVAWNLLTNAVKFTPEGGRVEVRLGPDDCGSAQITVNDTGKGIAAQFVPHVFERFRQGDASTTRVHGGLGLGLAIVRELVELHGGTVRVDSDGEGKGATFTVALPLLTRRQQTAAPRSDNGDGSLLPAPSQRLAGLNVLLVEDEAETRNALAWLLRESGAVVFTVGSAAAAYERLVAQSPDVLVSDIGLPGEDGYALLRRVRAMWSGRNETPAPALALTAYARGADRERALAAGFQAYAAKPVEPDELIRTIARLAGRSLEAPS